VEVLTGGVVDGSFAVDRTATSVVLGGLTNGESYTVRMQAVNAVGGGEWSAPSAPVTPTAPVVAPAAPGIGSVTAGVRSATVRWSAPAATGGSPVTEYRVQVLRNGTEVATVGGIAPTLRSVVVPGLADATTYTFRVRAVNAAGPSPSSAASAAVTTPGLPGVPPTVTASSGSAGGAVTAKAFWRAAAGNGSPVTGYVVRAHRMAPNGTVLATTTSRVQPAGARELSMALPAGTYRFTVQAVSAVGSGTPSARSNQVSAR